MNISLSFDAIKQSLVRALHRFHVVLFVVVVLGGLAAIVFTLNLILDASNKPDGYASSSNDASFDEQTITRVKELRQLNQSSSNLDLSGRSNPFVE